MTTDLLTLARTAANVHYIELVQNALLDLRNECTDMALLMEQSEVCTELRTGTINGLGFAVVHIDRMLRDL